jgi:hypothetical protein
MFRIPGLNINESALEAIIIGQIHPINQQSKPGVGKLVWKIIGQCIGLFRVVNLVGRALPFLQGSASKSYCNECSQAIYVEMGSLGSWGLQNVHGLL